MITISRRPLRLATLAEQHRMAAFRGVLQGGLQNHLNNNTLVRDVFGLNEDSGFTAVSARERAVQSKRRAMDRQRLHRAIGRG